MERSPFKIERVATALNLKRERAGKASDFNVQCPFCSNGKKEYKLNIDTIKDVWKCPKCGNKGGTLQLYAFVAHGIDSEAYFALSKECRSEIYKELCQLLGDNETGVKQVKRPAYNPQPEIPCSPVASDTELNKAYTALMRLDAFSLSPEHRENLLKRGLSKKVIEENGYRTIPNDLAPIISSKIKKEYDDGGWEAIRRKNPDFAKIKREEIVAGITVAEFLQSKGIRVEGVPGFFKFGERWCFRLIRGMFIPTRNRFGQIVGAQVRKETGDAKYLTVSSKNYPYGVREGIVRVHFPLHNAAITKDTKIIVTEGPLKADIAMFLQREDQPTAFMAIQGISNTSALQVELEALKEAGLNGVNIWNALDMDRITNRNVRSGSLKIKQVVLDAGFKMPQLLWDSLYAKTEITRLKELCKENDIPYTQSSGNVFSEFANLCILLEKYEVEHHPKPMANWNPATKGIDDYLLQVSKGR